METVLVNLAGRARYEDLNGRRYLVVPMTMLVPGVLNGSSGPLFYPPEEVSKDPSIWNHMPIVLGHPRDGNGNYISARQPSVLQECGLGFVFHSKYQNKLKAEGWFDVDTTNRICPEVLLALANGDKLELSTGLSASREPAPPGSVDSKGREYAYVARNYQPDHLAVLVGVKGACSLEDGCGVMVNQSLPTLVDSPRPGGPTVPTSADMRTRQSIWQRLGSLLGITRNQISHDELRLQLGSQLREKFATRDDPEGYNVYCLDVYDKYLVFAAEDRIWKLGYSTDNRSGTVTLSDDEPVEVRRQVLYKPVSNEGGDTAGRTDTTDLGTGPALLTGDDDMGNKLTNEQRKTVIDGLIANCSCGNVPWKEKDHNTLNQLSDDTLLAYDEVKKSLTGAKSGQDQTVFNQSFTDALGNRHVFNSQTGRWDTTLGQSQVHHVNLFGLNQPQQVGQAPAQVAQPVPTAPGIGNQGVPIAQPVTSPLQPRNMQEWIASMPPEAQVVWNAAQETVNREKAALIERLTANAANDQVKQAAVAIYTNMDIPQLRALASTIPTQAQTQQSAWNHDIVSVSGLADRRDQMINEEALPTPVMNWEPVGR